MKRGFGITLWNLFKPHFELACPVWTADSGILSLNNADKHSGQTTKHAQNSQLLVFVVLTFCEEPRGFSIFKILPYWLSAHVN